MSGYPYFALVGQNDNPIFEDWFDPKYADGAAANTQESEDLRYLHQFLVHKAIDAVDEVKWTTDRLNLKVVDDFNEWVVSSFITAGQVKLMLLHERTISNNDGIKNFFGEIYELYVKNLLNPFYIPGSPIKSPQFREKVNHYAKKYL